jgi:hypothetical protein
MGVARCEREKKKADDGLGGCTEAGMAAGNEDAAD